MLASWLIYRASSFHAKTLVVTAGFWPRRLFTVLYWRGPHLLPIWHDQWTCILEIKVLKEYCISLYFSVSFYCYFQLASWSLADCICGGSMSVILFLLDFVKCCHSAMQKVNSKWHFPLPCSSMLPKGHSLKVSVNLLSDWGITFSVKS